MHAYIHGWSDWAWVVLALCYSSAYQPRLRFLCLRYASLGNRQVSRLVFVAGDPEYVTCMRVYFKLRCIGREGSVP
ncbi:hypothetical protein EV127DRAFT_439168 [Xylaria flabelliformis]|nr:hypothetical protein EV127DRAFT_439168 [Xylaria flabelliformis]